MTSPSNQRFADELIVGSLRSPRLFSQATGGAGSPSGEGGTRSVPPSRSPLQPQPPRVHLLELR